MTKKKEKIAATFDEETSREVGQDPQQVDVEDEELDKVFAGFPQNEACIELYRTTDKGGKPAFLEDIMPADFTFGYVCRNYGGGKYIAKGRYKDGDVCKRSFDIEGPSFPVKRRVPAEVNEPRRAEVLDRTPEPVLMATDKNGQPDIMASVLAMMQTLVKESRNSEMEMLEKMKIYKDLFGAQEKPQAPLDQALNMFQRGVEMAGMNAGDGSNSSIWMMALRELKEPLTDIVATIKHAVTQKQPVMVNQPMMPTGQPIQPQPAAAQPAAAQPGEPQNMEMILLGAMKGMLPMLVTGAAQKAEEGFYADLMLDQIPRQYYTTAKVWLEKPDCLQRLNQMNPGVARFQGWFETLQRLLLEGLNAELAGDVGTIQPQSTEHPTGTSPTDL